MNIKQFFTGLFGRGKKSESTDIPASDAVPTDTTGNYVSITEPKPVASPPGWQPYTDKCHPIRRVRVHRRFKQTSQHEQKYLISFHNSQSFTVYSNHMIQGRRESPLAVLIFTGLKARRDTRQGRRVAGVKCSA